MTNKAKIGWLRRRRREPEWHAYMAALYARGTPGDLMLSAIERVRRKDEETEAARAKPYTPGPLALCLVLLFCFCLIGACVGIKGEDFGWWNLDKLGF